MSLLATFRRTLALTVCVAFCTGCASIGTDAAPSKGAVGTSEGEELALGKEVDAFWTGSLPVLPQHNPIALRVENLVQSLAPCCGRPELSYRTAVINDPADINAYAGPAGYIYVTTGLLEFLGTPDELALTIAHELAHVSGRHQVRTLDDQKRAKAGLHVVRVIAYYGAAVVGAQAQVRAQASGVGYAASVNAQRVGQLTSMAVESLANVSAVFITTTALTGYGRDRERQADRLGLTYVQRHGKYDPAAAVLLFHRFDVLEERAGKTQEGNAALHSLVSCLSSHPSSKERVKEADLQLAAMKVGKHRQRPVDVTPPVSLTAKIGPDREGPEILPVTPDEAWFALCRLVASDQRIRGIASCRRQTGTMKVNVGKEGQPECMVDVLIRAADPAGSEITVSASSPDRRWWPTLLMNQLKAELGVSDYSCLRGIVANPAAGSGDFHTVSGTRKAIYECLRKKVPWHTLFADEEAAYLHYRVNEGNRGVDVSVVVSVEAAGTCQVFIHQGPMAGGEERAAKSLIAFLGKEGYTCDAATSSTP